MPGPGYQGGIDVSIPIAMVIAGFFAVSIYNVLDVNIQVFCTFKKYTGLYFWSIIAASWGIVLHSVGFLLKFFDLCTIEALNITIITLGGVPMVIGQSVVLYSRLHLIVRDKRKIHWILVLIACGFFLFTVPPTILNYGANSSNPQPFLYPFEIYEKIALVGFCLQEFVISGLYMWETWRLLRQIRVNQKDDVRRVMKHLIYINIVIILMDLALLAIEFANLYQIETTYKSAMYSTKLKLELPILNQLRKLVKKRSCSCGQPLPSPYIAPLANGVDIDQDYSWPERRNPITLATTTELLPGRLVTTQVAPEDKTPLG